MSFRNAKVLAFEARRESEMAELIRINGGDPFLAPALVEVPLEQNEQAFEFADRLYAAEFEMMILLTGVGTRLLDRVLATREPESRFREALRLITTVVRGPKPSAVLRDWGITPTVLVPEPNTWRQVLKAIEQRPEQSVAVQEYGRLSVELHEGLAAQGRRVGTVSVYQWELPKDTAPLRAAVDGLAQGAFEAVLFTTSVQLDHLLLQADEMGKRAAVLEGLRSTFIASIGPTCTEALREQNLEPALEPSHPKMGILVRETALAFAQPALR